MDACRMKELRSCAGLTQAEVALELDVDKMSVSRWERGKHPIRSKIEGRIVTLMNDTERIAAIKSIRPSYVRGRPFVKKNKLT